MVVVLWWWWGVKKLFDRLTIQRPCFLNNDRGGRALKNEDVCARVVCVCVTGIFVCLFLLSERQVGSPVVISG